MLRKSAYILLIIGVLCLAGSLYAAWKVKSSLNGMEIDPSGAILLEKDSEQPSDQNAEAVSKPIDETPEAEDFYALMIGLDYRSGSHTLNTDTIIVAHVIPQQGKVKMLSLPRDLRMVLQSGEPRKINALFYDGFTHARWSANKNPDLLSGKKITLGGWTVAEEYFSSGMVHLRDRVEDFLDIEIKHSFLIHFETLIQLVDAVGGVQINVERSMQYDDPTDGTHIYFEPGLQKLDGQQALNYARFRQDNRGPAYYSDDFERAQRQQKLITALADKLSSWKSITRVFNILDVVSKSFKTDMTENQLFSFVRKYYDSFDGHSVESVDFVGGYWESPFVRILDEDLAELREQLISTEPVTASGPMSKTLRVLPD